MPKHKKDCWVYWYPEEKECCNYKKKAKKNEKRIQRLGNI